MLNVSFCDHSMSVVHTDSFIQNLEGSYVDIAYLVSQGSHRLEKYLNIEDFLEKSLKTKSAMKNTGESLQGLEKSLILLLSVGQHC